MSKRPFAATLPAGIDVPNEIELPFGSRLASAMARALEFLGGWVIVLGTVGVAYTVKCASSAPLRLLLAAWAFSGAVAYALRYYLLELFHFQKELYWVGAMLAVGVGVMGASFRIKGRVGFLAAFSLLLAVGHRRTARVWGDGTTLLRTLSLFMILTQGYEQGGQSVW